MPKLTEARRAYIRAYQAQWVRERREAWIQSRGGCCEQCGSREQLEVDHRDRATKQMNPRNIWSRRREVRDAELAKCQVLCAECHLAKTVAEAAPSHGTRSKYDAGCRCEHCRDAKAAAMRDYRSRTRRAA